MILPISGWLLETHLGGTRNDLYDDKLRPRRLLWSLNPLLMLIFADIWIVFFYVGANSHCSICNVTKMRNACWDDWSCNARSCLAFFDALFLAADKSWMSMIYESLGNQLVEWFLGSRVICCLSFVKKSWAYFFICSLMACRDDSILQVEIQLWECQFFDFLGFPLIWDSLPLSQVSLSAS